MTQVKEWSNQELNRKLAELMGWTEFKVDAYGGVWAVAPDDRWTNKMPDYCADAAASLEVQTAAIAQDPEEYIRNLSIVQCGPDPRVHEMVGVDLKGAARIANAEPRERAEAAYITLSSKQ